MGGREGRREGGREIRSETRGEDGVGEEGGEGGREGGRLMTFQLYICRFRWYDKKTVDSNTPRQRFVGFKSNQASARIESLEQQKKEIRHH